jgi:hypothetical protein
MLESPAAEYPTGVSAYHNGQSLSEFALLAPVLLHLLLIMTGRGISTPAF